MLAVDVYEGRLSLRLTVTAISKVVGISIPYIRAAAKLSTEERYAVRWGFRTLRDVTAPPEPSPEQRLDAIVAEVGTDTVLEMLARGEAAAAA
jgi:hypothetical protein